MTRARMGGMNCLFFCFVACPEAVIFEDGNKTVSLPKSFCPCHFWSLFCRMTLNSSNSVGLEDL